MLISSRGFVIIMLCSIVPTWLSSCATTRTYGTSAAINEDALARIHAGVSSSTDLRQLLGEPTEIKEVDQDSELWIYRYIEYRGAYIPLFGEVSTGNEQESEIKFQIRDHRVEHLERSQTKRKSGL